MTEADANSPLDGLLVVSIEQAVAAPLCTARLADAGARVIKIERQGGDFARAYDEAALGDSSYFVWINHGKESVVLDFKRPEDAALVERMISSADVFVQNLAPGALAKVGLDSGTLRGRYPRLITCDISGYGESEALQGMKAYDLLVQAESGLVSISGAPGQPGRIGVSLCDIGAGVTAHAAILEAIIARGINGRGRGVAVSLFDVAAEWMSVPLIHAETGDGPPRQVGLRHPSIAPYGAFRTSEGELTLISIQNEREWLRLCHDVLDSDSLASDPRFVDNVSRVQHRDALESQMNDVTGKRSAADFRTALLQASIAYGALNSVEDLGSHPALRRRQLSNSERRMIELPAHPVRQLEHPAVSLANSRESVASPMRDPIDVPRPQVPRLGEHTAAVRAEFASAAGDAMASTGPNE